jgi:hypothetical protein
MTPKTAALMDTSAEMEVMQGNSWFALFFWPAFRRIFSLDNNLSKLW